ncbi:MAG: Eco57I restriction-modification methylase domain-containing protein, partial [Thermoanaerobaculia bacterium]
LANTCPVERTEAVADEALLIMSRLLFLCFVQEKGWLNGERRFLIDRADRCCESGADFFGGVLVPLFFGCLNTPTPQRDHIAQALGRIPYLNGGLFEPSAFERRNPSMGAPSELMRRIIEDVFEKFDFTIEETDGAGTRVDPEMLGKVFESLMAEDERAVSGSFYTPREIVDALTSRGIAEWTSGGDAALRDQLMTIMGGGEVAPSVRELAADVVRRLESVTILDPACGSGAFLLSAMSAIEKLIMAFTDEAPCGLRQRIVERSLYGVDLKPEAVRLCELRLWLAIVSGTSATLENVRPLPNLDRNILQGNSLLGPLDFLGTARGDIYREWAYGIRAQSDLVRRYRRACRADRPAILRVIRANDRRIACDLLQRAIDADERELQRETQPRQDLFGRPVAPDDRRCDELRSRVSDTRRNLERAEEGELDFFAYDVHFSHVMANGGFDVVVGNPPWVRTSRIDPQLRKMYRDRYQLFGNRQTGAGNPFHQPDLSVAFFERAFALGAATGVVSMLMPAKIANATYAAPLRRFAQQLSIIEIIDWTDDRRRYFTADTFPLGIVARRAPAGDTRVSAGGESFVISQRDLSIGNEWTLVPPEVNTILFRLRNAFMPLQEALGRRPIMGVKTGDNRRFFLDAKGIEAGHLVTTDDVAIPIAFVCRCVRGRDVRRWSTAESQWMLWPPRDGWRDLPPWLQQLAVRRGVEPQALRLSYVRPEHVGIKVAWKDVSKGFAAAVLPDAVYVNGHSIPLVPNQTLYSIDAVSLDETYAISGVLNSVIVDALMLAIAERAKDDHYRYFARTVASIPMPPLIEGSPQWEKLVRSARAAHQKRATPAGHDELIAALYGLSPGDLETLRTYVERRLPTR